MPTSIFQKLLPFHSNVKPSPESPAKSVLKARVTVTVTAMVEGFEIVWIVTVRARRFW